MPTLNETQQTMLTEGKTFAVLSTLMADGSPQASLIWIDGEGERIVFNTAEGRVKTRNIRRDPRVALAVFDPEQPYKQLMVRGRVVEITKEGADAHIDRLAMKYLGKETYPYRQPGEVRLIVKVEADRVGDMG